MSIFSSIKVKKPRRSTFDLSHEVKTTSDFGKLVPILCQEVMPGDTFRLTTQIFARMAPMIAPIMSRVDIYTHFFFVPTRLVWDRWEEFITGGEDGMSTPPIPVALYGDMLRASSDSNPWVTDSVSSSVGEDGIPNTLYSHFGIPKCHINEEINLLPFRAYQLIWNEWYRDQNLQEEIPIYKDLSGVASPIQVADLVCGRYRCWKKDYFTSALPWPQRGPDVKLPIGDVGIVPSSPASQEMFKLGINPDDASKWNMGTVYARQSTGVTSDTFGLYVAPAAGIGSGLGKPLMLKDPQLRGNGISSGPTINEMRRSIRVQEWLEKNARGGARYIEQILSHFGVRSSDSRLQRTEFIGGGKSPVIISEVVQQSSTDAESPQGNLAGHGVTAQSTHGFKRFFEEHGYLIGIMSIMPKASYQQGLARMWSRKDKFDFPWPEFANLGEQEILNKEIFAAQTNNADAVFGYAPRYSEFKYMPSHVSGLFVNQLSFWHLGRIFSNPPALNEDFVSTKNLASQASRIFPTHEGDHFYLQIFHNLKAKRPLPYYGVPTI